MGYTKLFTEIIMSTIWREPDHVRLLWITMLALKDRWHVVNASLPGLADSARITMKQCEEALAILSSPDLHSRTKDYDGRRIEACDGGWLVLNGEKYRNKMSIDERREYQRIKQKEYREKKKAFTSCLQSSQQITHTDTDTDTKADTDTDKKKREGFRPPSLQEVTDYCLQRNNGINPSTFVDFYESKGWVIGKSKMKNWKSAIHTWEQRKKEEAKNGNQRNKTESARDRFKRKTGFIDPLEGVFSITDE